MSLRITPPRDVVNRITRRISELEREATYELARISQKRQLLWQIEMRMQQLKPMLQEYEVLSLTPLPSRAYRERLEETSRAAREYRSLQARRDALQREIMREENRLYAIRSEVDRLNRLLTQYTAPPIPTEELPVTMEQAERELRMLERMLAEARARGDIERMIEIQRRMDELMRRMGYRPGRGRR